MGSLWGKSVMSQCGVKDNSFNALLILKVDVVFILDDPGHSVE